MNTAEIDLKELGATWLASSTCMKTVVAPNQVHAVAAALRKHNLRFVTIVCMPCDVSSFRVMWYWDLKGALYSVETSVKADEPLPTISDIYPGADWMERETRDYYAVVFDGRFDTPPLMLRENDEPGILLRKGER
jgi:NADH:ubiquinone oxidoreductase subunit C